MSISGIPVSSPAPVNYNYPDNSPQAQTPAAATDNGSSDANASQPVQSPPLPPGQGTRVNQLV